MELEVYKIDGKKTDRKVQVNDKVFGIEPNDHAIYLDVKQYLANQRQGTHSTKERNEVMGSTRKMKRQKGTGTARFGDIKNPIFRGGGRTFGPSPRDYGFKLNKKLKNLARRSALSYKVKDNGFMIVEDFTLEDPKTRNFVEILNNFELAEQKILFVMTKADRNILLSIRNLKKARVINASDLNTYEILNANKLLVCESSLEQIEKLAAN